MKQRVNTREKILVIRLSSIGDIVQCSAVPRHLKNRFPDAELHWLVRSDNQELVEHQPHIDEVISFDRKTGLQGWIRLCQKLKSRNYTHVYDAHNNLRSRILTLFLKPSFFVRRSKDRLKRFFLFWLKINLFPKRTVAVDSYLAPLKKWNVFNDHKGSELFLPLKTFDKVRQLMPADKKWIALAPATAWKKKTWPRSHWTELILALLGSTEFHLLILGGPQDTWCDELILNRERILSLQGKLTLLESAAAAHYCETLIAADTGLLHMAEALKMNVVAILGPTPFGHPARVGSHSLQTNLWCQPCSKDGRGPCINLVYQKCMKLITAPEVLSVMNKVLRESS